MNNPSLFAARSVGSLATLLALSCTGGQSGDEGGKGLNPPPADGGDRDGAPPSMGPNEQPPVYVCESDAECRSYVEAFVEERIARPLEHGGVLEIAQCVEGCGKDGVCACMYHDADRPYLDSLELHVLGAAELCDARSRARYCLAPASAFPGCSPDVATSCDVACRELGDALARDAQGREVEVAAARCDEGRCLSVWEVEGHCLIGAPIPSGLEVDCAVSYDAVLDELAATLPPAPREPPAGSDAPPSMSGGAQDAGFATPGVATPRMTDDEPIEASSWVTTTSDDGAVWLTGGICGAEIGPVCVHGPCPSDDADGGR